MSDRQIYQIFQRNVAFEQDEKRVRSRSMYTATRETRLSSDKHIMMCLRQKLTQSDGGAAAKVNGIQLVLLVLFVGRVREELSQ